MTVTTPELVSLNSSYTAKVGFLANGTVLTTNDNFASINANWTNAGNIAFASGDAAGYSGYFSGKATFTDASGLAGKNVFVWFTNGSDLNAVLGTSQIQFLADSAIPNENAPLGIESANVGTGLYWNIALGEKVANPANLDGGGSFKLVGIPEPSAALLGALGALGLLRRRRI